MLERKQTSAEREAEKAFKPPEKIASSDYDKAQRAFQENRERLKAERLARESAGGKSER